MQTLQGAEDLACISDYGPQRLTCSISDDEMCGESKANVNEYRGCVRGGLFGSQLNQWDGQRFLGCWPQGQLPEERQRVPFRGLTSQ